MKTPIEIAREYIHSAAMLPALRHPLLSKELKRKVKHSESWIDHFQRVGDLLLYLKRFDASNSDPTYVELNKIGLKTFEDIASEFETKFSFLANDYTRSTDFIIGENYDVHQILIFARSYDTRSGGMFVLESGGVPSAVVIKATLSGGSYANEWLSEPNRLKYYLKSMKGKFGENYKPNAAILNIPLIPILTFVRQSESDPFTYQGIFNYQSITRESDGSKWFDLQRAIQQPKEVLAEATYIAKTLEIGTKKSAKSSRDKRLARLATASKKPARIQVVSTAFIRNPDVVAEVLFRAKGTCESCEKPAPFAKRSDSSPYLEVHHRIPLSADGDDSVDNAIALCPNCHRKYHFG
jgi:5-methylcytosine-specific restriction protein A